MILSEKQIQPDDLYSIISGGFWQHWRDNPNFFCALILPYSWCLLPVSVDGSNASRWNTVGIALEMCRSQARTEVEALQIELLGNSRSGGSQEKKDDDDDDDDDDEINSFPRIFIVSLSWTYQDITSLDHTLKTFIFCDHVLVLIKHNKSFRIVQGYKATPRQHPALLAEDIETSPYETSGMNLAGWHKSGNEFSSPSGFNSEKMIKFISHLQAFASNQTWDDENHFSAFHGRDRYCTAANQYWPAFSYKEVEDKVSRYLLHITNCIYSIVVNYFFHIICHLL